MNRYQKYSQAWPFYINILEWGNEEKRAKLFNDEKDIFEGFILFGQKV